MAYTSAEVRTLTPVRENVERGASAPDLRNIFLCHAWDDRKGSAKELHDVLESLGVSVWLSEKDVLLGSSLLLEIDKGLAKSRVGMGLPRDNGRQEAILTSLSWRLSCTQPLAAITPMSSRFRPLRWL
ncbi:toll/interleukin-1 receptor domain-containing protein, partial [Pseudomonas sp. LB-090624]|uniref:toll/interleukin-1 receptor domain-containing protein n=1 Tax=Pseudomonas sp. LB-090624 TaxID=2213079 RepID=UPI00211436FD